MSELVSQNLVEQKIYLLRGKKVMLSHDLATLYGVEPRVLVQAVKRNLERFPDDFMFQLNKREYEGLKFQIGTSNLKSQFVISSWGGSRATPYAFTEQGVAMLSSILKSKKAIRVNIEIMRAFARLREILATNKDFARRLEELERKFNAHDHQFQAVFDAIKQLMKEPEKPKRRIGFLEESKAIYKVN